MSDGETSAVAVSQAEYDWLADAFEADGAKATAAALRSGETCIINSRTVAQALARHRLTSTPQAASAEVRGAISASEQVARWQQEHLAFPGSHWGDAVAWNSAFIIAKKLDALAAVPAHAPINNGEVK